MAKIRTVSKAKPSCVFALIVCLALIFTNNLSAKQSIKDIESTISQAEIETASDRIVEMAETCHQAMMNDPLGDTSVCYYATYWPQPNEELLDEMLRLQNIMSLACEQGSMQGCHHVAQALFFGFGKNKPSPFKSLPLYDKACAMGSGDSCYASTALRANLGEISSEEIQAQMKHACEHGSVKACSLVE